MCPVIFARAVSPGPAASSAPARSRGWARSSSWRRLKNPAWCCCATRRPGWRSGPPVGLLILPAIAGLTWIVNPFAGLWLHRNTRERAAAYLLLAATLFVQALVWVATLSLLTAGNAA